jgi:maltodextrin utilization protein YvdJ
MVVQELIKTLGNFNQNIKIKSRTPAFKIVNDMLMKKWVFVKKEKQLNALSEVARLWEDLWLPPYLVFIFLSLCLPVSHVVLCVFIVGLRFLCFTFLSLVMSIARIWHSCRVSLCNLKLYFLFYLMNDNVSTLFFLKGWKSDWPRCPHILTSSVDTKLVKDAV